MQILLDFILNRYMYDWDNIRTAFVALFAGRNPYTTGRDFFNPIWALYLLAPIMMLPYGWQPFLVMCAYLIANILIARKFNYKGLSLFFVLSNPALWYGIGYGNIDWLAWLGLLLPVPIGIILLAIKPQVTWVVILVLLVKEWKKGKLLQASIPLLILGISWLLIYGFQYTTSQNIGNAVGGIWPYSLILGIPLVIISLWKQNIKLAILAAPFCMPYYSTVSMSSMVFVDPFLGWTALWVLAIKTISTLINN